MEIVVSYTDDTYVTYRVCSPDDRELGFWTSFILGGDEIQREFRPSEDTMDHNPRHKSPRYTTEILYLSKWNVS